MKKLKHIFLITLKLMEHIYCLKYPLSKTLKLNNKERSIGHFFCNIWSLLKERCCRPATHHWSPLSLVKHAAGLSVRISQHFRDEYYYTHEYSTLKHERLWLEVWKCEIILIGGFRSEFVVKLLILTFNPNMLLSFRFELSIRNWC